MASSHKEVKIENIDLILRNAEISRANLDILHRQLSTGDVKLCAEIRSKFETIFRDMMSSLSSVLDQMLQLPAIRKVDQSGTEVPGPDGGPRANKIQHDASGNLSQFNPRQVIFEGLKPEKKMADWNDKTVSDLTDFFKNRLDKRCRIECVISDGYLNLQTRALKARHIGENLSNNEQWVFIAKGVWILVQEQSQYHRYKLLTVCENALSFVKDQRNALSSDVGSEYPYEISWDWSGTIHLKWTELWVREWQSANLWPLEN